MSHLLGRTENGLKGVLKSLNVKINFNAAAINSHVTNGDTEIHNRLKHYSPSGLTDEFSVLGNSILTKLSISHQKK